jgi:integrase/recombinase XerD
MGKKGYSATGQLRHRSVTQRGGQEAAEFPQGEAGTIAHLASCYLENLAVKNLSERTITSRAQTLKIFLHWTQDRELNAPSAITKPILESYQRHLFRHRKTNGKPLSIGSQRNQLCALRGLFTWLTRQNHLAANPASDLEMPRPEKRLPSEALGIEQVRQLLAIPDTTDLLGLRDRAMLELFYSTGIRRLELTQLEVTDLNPERQTLRVRQGKGGKDRVVPVGNRALKWLERYLEEVRPRLVFHASERHLFLTSYGGPFAANVLSRMVSKWLKQTDIGRPGSCHLLRHSCATHLLEGGADIRYIQQLLGHENLETTAIYTQVSIEKLKAVHALCHPAERAENQSSKNETERLPLPP